ncbi:hypothetical protein N866_19805 [Actinotalea ferrariae CF5-4]|uniref:Cellobiose phosphorylase n=1 Tax=Actinotalea ferrariae CF5-4 TaxID=948458 RepID=A0A021VR11_9CELL|nr:hypothetical protein N866_19805 [Actinotalea ferrariae CF5-4]
MRPDGPGAHQENLMSIGAAARPTALSPSGPDAGVTGDLVDLDGRRFYRIRHVDRMPPFFMTLVGASDLWVFLASTGGVTAGRVEADRALFPYTTEDKVTDGVRSTGGLTVLRVATDDGVVVWEPFAPLRPGDPAVERDLYKDVLGTTLVMEETRPDLGLRFRATWQTSARYGVVRGGALASTGATATGTREVEVLDGFRNLLPAGATVQVQNELSSLLDAYKRTEVDPATGLGLLYLNSHLTDLAEPSESLHANVAWQVGLDDVDHLLSDRQVTAFAFGDPVAPEAEVRGERGAYLVRSRVALAPGQERRWSVVADVDLDAAAVVDLQADLAAGGLATRLAEDVAATRAELERLVTTADGAQVSGDELAAAHHAANVLFNLMRGGIPVDGYAVEAADVRRFVEQRSPRTAARRADVLDALPEQLSIGDLLQRAQASGDADLRRLAAEYLPLTFSRRHGDPSRPWNKFRIALTDDDGRTRVDYQGNWRDIFQNWEALAWSFPEYVESMTTVFLDATTADGYNPYRISRSGIDWEVPEPENPWANIGYWSDHQVVYLCKLIETSLRFHPDRLPALVDAPLFTHADVPYRLASYRRTVADPSSTITFDTEAHAAVEKRVATEGADGRLVRGADGDLVRVTLAEKLLLTVLAKLVNLVPEGGIWMNTQRPEWNDANNALVGRGLSVVTLAYVRRYLDVVEGLLDRDVTVTTELGDLFRDVLQTLTRHVGATVEGFTDGLRRTVMDELGAAGTAYRSQVYGGFDGHRVTLEREHVRALLDVARRYVDSGLRANRREDGLFHSYNVIDLGSDHAGIRRLQVMLEGQVAVLSSGLLGPAEARDVLAALRTSPLYRADQHSYMLYPDRDLPTLLDKNRVPAARATSPLFAALVEAGDRSVVLRDRHGDYRFAPAVRNERHVRAGLAAAASSGAVDPALVAQERGALLEVFEEVFHHAEFTGRSGSFFAFEGLGSIYWHMVSKLLLAVQEHHEQAVATGAPADVVADLAAAYEDVRQGLGYCKSPQQYGAFPVDPYSHTPAGRGARQPGMTGQVKEEVLTRLGELGLRVEEGRVVVRPALLRPQEWTTAPTTFRYRDVGGAPREVDLPAGSLAFTFCQVPVLYRADDDAVAGQVEADRDDAGGVAPVRVSRVEVLLADGRTVQALDGVLPADLSAAVFARTGLVERITAQLG